MRFFDDPGKALQQMEDELLEEDWEEDEEDVDEDGEDFQILTRRSSRPAPQTPSRPLPDQPKAPRQPRSARPPKRMQEIILPTAKAGKSSGRKVPAVLCCCSLGNWPVSPVSSGGG